MPGRRGPPARAGFLGLGACPPRLGSCQASEEPSREPARRAGSRRPAAEVASLGSARQPPRRARVRSAEGPCAALYQPLSARQADLRGFLNLRFAKSHSKWCKITFSLIFNVIQSAILEVRGFLMFRHFKMPRKSTKNVAF